MTNDEIKGAIEWADISHPTLSIPAINILQALAEEYLKVEGWPEERCFYKRDFNNERLYDRAKQVEEGFNEALHLCKLAAMKEKMENNDYEDLKKDFQILKDFILGFTSRDTDKEWQAFRRIRTQVEVLANKEF